MAKSALFIDGQGLVSTARALGFEVDFKRLIAMFEKGHTLLRAYFYASAGPSGEYDTARPLLDWLEYNGFTVRTTVEPEHGNQEGRRRTRQRMRIDLTVDAMETAKYLENAFLFSGDGDYRALVEALQRRGVRVTVISSLRPRPTPMIADALRRQADLFIELDTLRSAIARSDSRSQSTPEDA